MYNVLIVDDEQWVVESLRNGIAWQEHGFEVVDHAYDGAEALDKVRRLKPDLVFTDIRMPEMGGLDLIRQVRLDRLPIEFVVVSGYAEFAYAQKALHYGVMGFCLKPAEDTEVNAVLDRVRSVLDHRHTLDEEAAEEMVGIAEGRPEDTFADRLSHQGFTWADGSDKHVLARRGRSDVLKLSAHPVYSGLIGLNYRIWILEEAAYKTRRDAISEIAETNNTLIGISRTFDQARGIDGAVQEAIVACNQQFMGEGLGMFEFPDRPDTATLRAALGTLGNAIRAAQQEQVRRSFSSIAALLESGYTVKHASFVYNAIHYMITAGGFEDREPVYHFEEMLGIYPDVDYMLKYLEDTVTTYLTADIDDREQHARSAVEKAVDYVDRNLFDDISLKALAEQFYISPSHLCRTFKKATGEPLTQYITRKRIEYACSLLEDTDLAVSEIAEKSGYENYFYFARVFKRIKGRTPTEHRAFSR